MSDKPVRVLGVSGSLRNARFGAGSEALVSDLSALSSEDELLTYLKKQTQFRFDDFVEAGRGNGLPFDQIYAELRKLRGIRGLSNSEAALASALWAAQQEGAEVQHVSLASHFPLTGKGRHLDVLREKVESADAIIISGPVYFGDRGSLAQSFIEFISADADLKAACKGKVYAGLAVGAKRNGGQETTLIYQMLDMVNLDFFAVGNGSETTAQYGGTAVAGDVGKFADDAYGLNTCVGTGRRAARVAQMLRDGRTAGVQMRDKLKVQLWLLQDAEDGAGRKHFEAWIDTIAADDADVEFELMDFTREQVTRCIACDICPIDVGPKDEYRCIITSAQDVFVKRHQDLVAADAILFCAYSPKDRASVVSVYQQFIERTRYIRRDHYALSDILMAPFVISELSARQNLHLRMLTSGIRQHTVMHHPIIGIVHEGALLAADLMVETGKRFVDSARELTIGRYLRSHDETRVYRPIGYEVSVKKAQQDHESGRTNEIVSEAAQLHDSEGRRRLSAGE